MNRTVHVVCLDAPSPPNYGGAIDIFYKVKALAEAGNGIILHYFDYKPRRDAGGLERYCQAVHTYRRRSVITTPPLLLSHVIGSRINAGLIKNLNRDNHCILLEGLHCAGIVPYVDSSRIVLRMHNNEPAYYQQLAKASGNWIQKLYFKAETGLLHRYQQRLPKDVKLACLSAYDASVFEKDYGFARTHFIPCFVPWQKLNTRPGTGTYCLYHGNMTVAENNAAALWLLQEIFHRLPVPLVIAGKGVSTELMTAAATYAHVSVRNNPGADELAKLIEEAHVHVLPSLNRTGVKLKLLNALFNGRHCLTNTAGVAGSGIGAGVVVEDSAKTFADRIQILMDTPFTAENAALRGDVLERYNNRRNAEALSALW